MYTDNSLFSLEVSCIFVYDCIVSVCRDRANSAVSDYMVALSDYVKTIKYSMMLDPGTLRGLVASASR